MIAKERELLHEVADAVGALMEFWGFKRLMGRVWTLLYLRGEPLSAAELCEQLEISSGAASMTLAEMEHWGVVVRSRKAGDRREYFEAEADIWRMISRVLRERELSQIERALEVFERARSQLERLGVPAEHARLHQIATRIDRLADLARLGRALLVAVVQQGKADLAPLMRFTKRR
ncbi:MAG TPA: MarR family transcriptional regulator [Myxococcales bacterium]|jgi:DNA-binding transcriptional regulator GbsR (MarR family)